MVREATPPPPPPTPSVATQIEESEGTPCCPLLADEERLYTCLCAGSAVDLVSVDPDGGSPTRLARLAPRDQRQFYATALADNRLYWIDYEVGADSRTTSFLQETLLATGATRLVGSLVADVFDLSSVLVDSREVFALASRVGDEGEEGQILALDRETGEARNFPTGTRWVGYDMVQDEAALYLVTATAPDIERTSRIERFAKADGERTTLSQISVAAGLSDSGYSGLFRDKQRFFAISMDPTADGAVAAKLLEIDEAGEPRVLYAQEVDAGASFRVLGVVDGVVLLTRTQSSVDRDENVSQRSTLLLVPSDGTLPRVAAEFLGDRPLGHVVTPSFDPEALFWLNASGKLFRLSRLGLDF